MVGSAKPYDERRSDPNGVGPFRFRSGEDFGAGSLASGAKMTLDLRNDRFNGMQGYYVNLSPAGYDSLEVTNKDGSEDIHVVINENGELDVPASTTQSRRGSGMYRFTIANDGGASISQGDIVLEIQKEPLGADEAARREASANPLGSVIENFTGVNPLTR
jgi:hypothetical protein